MPHITDSFNIDIEGNVLGSAWRGASPNTPPAPTGQWIGDILKAFTKIAVSEAGVALLNSIKEGGVWIVVAPPAMSFKCNSHANSFGPRLFNGRRYGAVVEFDPAQYRRGDACYSHKKLDNCVFNRGAKPDEVFFHELVHAHRQSLGKRDHTDLLPGLKRYTSAEEFIAVVMTNVYISDVTNRDKSGLRRDHVGKGPLEKVLSDSFGFFAASPQVLPLLKIVRTDHPKLFDRLAEVVAEFNPFYVMKNFEKEAENMSQDIANRRAVSIPKEKIVTSGHLPPPSPAKVKKALSSMAEEALSVLQRVAR